MVFNDINAVDEFLVKEAVKRGFPLNRMVSERDYYHSSSNWTEVVMRCKYCHVTMKFQKWFEGLKVRKVNNEHMHSLLKLNPSEVQSELEALYGS